MKEVQNKVNNISGPELQKTLWDRERLQPRSVGKELMRHSVHIYNNELETIELNKKRFWALAIVILFFGSIFATFGTTLVETSLFESKNANVIQINDREPLTYTYEEPQYGMSDSIKGSVYGQFEQHPALLDPGLSLIHIYAADE